MQRLPIAIATVALAGGVLAACSSDDEQASGTTTAAGSECPRQAGTTGAYASRFEGDVTMDAATHVLRVTRDGRPLAGARVCVSTAMVGMTSMHYTARGREIAPGRYEVPIRFEMRGRYTGTVVTQKGDDEAAIPLSVEVMDASKTSAGTEDDTMTTTTGGAMAGDEDDEMDDDGR